MIKLPKLKFPIKLDIGCGFNQYLNNEGYVGIDIADYGQDVVWDITKGLPFPDSSIKNFFSCHVLEHLTWSQITELFKEIWRTGTPDAEFQLRVPSATNPDVMAGDHKTVFTGSTLLYLLKEFNAEEDSPYQFRWLKIEEVPLTPYDEVQALIVINK